MNSPATAKQTSSPPADPLAAALAAAGADPKKKTPPLTLARFRTIGFSARDWGNVHGATVTSGTALDEILQPDFWSLVAPSLNVGDWIRVLTDDQAFEALLTVRAVSGPGSGLQNNRAIVAKLNFWTFDPVADPAVRPTTHRVEYKGTHLKWCIIRAADNEQVKKGFASEEDARSGLTALLRVQKQ
jgi:hypothetical protein